MERWRGESGVRVREGEKGERMCRTEQNFSFISYYVINSAVQ